ncbi:MAG: hypothetical protein R6X34_08755 [Chloroflexota bacterium]
MPPQTPPFQLVWESLPPTRQQELSQLLAALLHQYLTAEKRRTAALPAQETPHDPSSQDQ